jgi:spermidine synthase
VTKGVIYDGDSAYSRLQVLESTAMRPKRFLLTDNVSAQSGVYLDEPNEPLFEYIRAFSQAAAAAGEVRRVLLIGGGAYTLPRLILQQYPEARVDVVEIDPKLDELAERYFGWQPDPRVRIIHTDGRVFLNTNQQDYDLIYMDAFSSLVPPFQLATTEAVAKLARGLASGGAVVVNLVGAPQGKGAAFVEAEYATYHEHFGLVSVAQAQPAAPPQVVQNLLLVAGTEKGRASRIAAAPGMSARVLVNVGQVLTDDFAPVEQLLAR